MNFSASPDKLKFQLELIPASQNIKQKTQKV